MRRYTAGDEERLRVAAKVRDWTRSGLLTADQARALEASLGTDLKRTNRIFRAVLFIFGTIIVWAMVGLTLVSIGVNEAAVGVVAIVFGCGCLFAADFLVANSRLYRFGIEEALAVWSVAFLGGGVGLLTGSVVPGSDDLAIVLGLIASALVSLAVYTRFGYRYAAVAAVAGVAIVPFFTNLPPGAARLLSAAILAAAIVTVRSAMASRGDTDFPGDDYSVVEAAAWAGLYVVLNLVMSSEALVLGAAVRGLSPAFYWATYVAIWLIPPSAFYLGIRDKRRVLIWAGLAMALATLVTNKTYLGWPRHPWDPILLGLILAGGCIVVRRWLSRSPNGQRNGFTPDRILASQRQTVDTLGMVAGIAQPAITLASPAPAPKPAIDVGHGGRSGGAGASGSF